MPQEYTSANTSRRQVPKLARAIVYDLHPGSTILDYGCGKYPNTKKFFTDTKINYTGYDPYHLTEEENRIALSKKYDYAICCSVLNVIKEKEIRQAIMLHLTQLANTSIISIYEGDRSGVGKKTRYGWQNHQRTKFYISEAKELGFFPLGHENSFLLKKELRYSPDHFKKK